MRELKNLIEQSNIENVRFEEYQVSLPMSPLIRRCWIGENEEINLIYHFSGARAVERIENVS